MKDITSDRLTCLLFGILVGAILTIILFCYSRCKSEHTFKEDMTKIDSLTKVNDSIKIKIEKLDSIKDAKIIEVSTLNNDSTLKLFYKLVKE